MPANKKYLSSPGQRFLKITAGTIGGYLVMINFHLLLSCMIEKKYVIITSFITGYILWAILLLVAFLAKNGWKIWGVYLLLAVLFYLPFLIK
ncbi:hypothetical protein [Sphingobacterium bovistauri]|uniref:Uncharacterized protein n=1 Tax=Sphingobacterium bovistauri TaxID=2781959 RepID=A0ABS7ZBK8_9SPHI|nr:hypothetical protein [Sphingobacterium bovistauri]MCA5006265.1 hypothetical protein [Sphingobacterium bovistauri]